LLKPGPKAEQQTVVLEVAGTIAPLDQGLQWEQNGLATLKVDVAGPRWPANMIRQASEPEECLVIADPASSFLPIGAAKLSRADGSWTVDPSMSIDSSWQGACVVSRSDGKLIGILLIDDERGRIALLPEQAVQP
jgi:hypothetical protein